MTTIVRDETLASDRSTLEALQARDAPLAVLDLWSPLYATDRGERIHRDPNCSAIRGASLEPYPAMEGLRWKLCARCTAPTQRLGTIHDSHVAERLRQQVANLLAAEGVDPQERFAMTLSAMSEVLPACDSCEHHLDALPAWSQWYRSRLRALQSSALREVESPAELLESHESRALAGAVGIALGRELKLPLSARAAWRDAFLAGEDAPARLRAARQAEAAQRGGPLSLADFPRDTELEFRGGNLHDWLRSLAETTREDEVAAAVARMEALLVRETARRGRRVLAGFQGLRSFPGASTGFDPEILVHYQPVVVGEKVFANLPLLLAEQADHAARKLATSRAVNLAGREEQLRLAAELWDTGLTLSQAWLAAGRALR